MLILSQSHMVYMESQNTLVMPLNQEERKMKQPKRTIDVLANYIMIMDIILKK